MACGGTPADCSGLPTAAGSMAESSTGCIMASPPTAGDRLTRNAGSEKRSPGLDMTFSADKSVSALWAIADPELRSEIERAHNDAARAALAETVLRSLRLDAASGARRNQGRGGGHHGRDVPAWHQPRERPAASYPLHDLQCRDERTGTASTGHCTSTRSMPG